MTGPKEKERLGTGFSTIFEMLTSSLHTSLPGIVTSFDANERTISVQPTQRRQFKGEEESRILPIENDVPVNYPGSDEFALEFELKEGDEVLLITAERSLDEWMEEGGIVEVSDPRTFDLSDAVAVAGLTTKARSKAPIEAGISLRKTDDSVAVKVQDGIVTAKVGAMSFEVTDGNVKARPTGVVLDTDVQAYATLPVPAAPPGYVSLASHTHQVITAGAPSGTPIPTPGLP